MTTLTRIWLRDDRLTPWLVAVFALSLADCLTTLYGLRHGQSEANFLAIAAFASIGLWPALVAKECITALVLTFHALSAIYWPRTVRWLVIGECALMACVVFHNCVLLAS